MEFTVRGIYDTHWDWAEVFASFLKRKFFSQDGSVPPRGARRVKRLTLSNHGAVLSARGDARFHPTRGIIAKILHLSFAKIATNSY
jgi:hypothetical protein